MDDADGSMKGGSRFPSTGKWTQDVGETSLSYEEEEMAE